MTLAIILAVLAGPSVVNCFNGQGGMGACLRDEMTQAGILPPAVPAKVEATATTSDPIPTPSTPATTDVALAPATPSAPAQDQSDTVVAASFGLRVEPDGSVVIAGSGQPGSELEVYADDDLIGQATVEPSGDWVLVPDAPLPTGGVEITLGEAGKPGRAPESFVVAIAEDRVSEPLVVASVPGAASDVLQGLTPAEPMQLAAADPVAAPVQPTAPVASSPAQQPATAPLTATSAPTPTPAPAADDPIPATATTTPSATPAPGPAPTAVAAADPAPVTSGPTAPTTDVPVTIDAIEIDGNRTFFAGAGPEGATTRLYIDDTFIADTIVSGGRWLVQAGRVLTQARQRVRVDLLGQGSADVQSRAEVNFEIDLPADAANPQAIAAAPSTSVPGCRFSGPTCKCPGSPCACSAANGWHDRRTAL